MLPNLQDGRSSFGGFFCCYFVLLCSGSLFFECYIHGLPLVSQWVALSLFSDLICVRIELRGECAQGGIDIDALGLFTLSTVLIRPVLSNQTSLWLPVKPSLPRVRAQKGQLREGELLFSRLASGFGWSFIGLLLPVRRACFRRER